MRLRLARQGDIHALSLLWRECFEDEDDYIALFYRHRFDSIRVALATDDEGNILGMIHLLPCTVNAQNGFGGSKSGVDAFGRNAFGTNAYYLYAVGMARAWRGRGVMRILMTSLIDECKKRSIALLLSPVNERLNEYYRSYGFEFAAGDFREFFDAAALGELADVTWRACACDDYFASRTACLSTCAHVAFARDAVDYALLENDFCGGAAFVSSAGDCALVQKEERHLVVRELCVSTSDAPSARARLAALLAHCGANSCEVRSHLALSARARAFQSVMACGADVGNSFGYMNLLLD